QRRLRSAAIDVVDAEHVGEKDAVEQPTFERAGEPGPIIEIGVVHRPVARMRPEAGRLMPHAVHLEGVEADFLHGGKHRLTYADDLSIPRSGTPSPPYRGTSPRARPQSIPSKTA